MFSFLRKKKLKKAIDTNVKTNAVHDDKENEHRLYPSTSEQPYDKNLTDDKIHIDTSEHCGEKLQLIYHSSESTPRHLCHSTSNQTYPTMTNTSIAIAPNDLSRVLTSGYLNGEKNLGYLKRGTGDHIASSICSSQFHRPIGFSYNRRQILTMTNHKKGMKALVTGQTKVRKIHCSPASTVTITDQPTMVEKEAIVLSRYSGGFVPDPAVPKKIESLDWPAPIAIQAVPQLLKTYRRRSEDSLSNSSRPMSMDVEVQLDKDIDQISKLKESSGMAQALLEELRLREKFIARQLPLDPWKASRSPSAAIEPHRRCRFESPKFASPSRRVYTHSSSTTNPDESMAILSSLSNTGKRISLPRYSQSGLRHDGVLDMQRSCDLDSTMNSYSTEGEQTKSIKTVDIDGRYNVTDAEFHHEPSTRSAPALMNNLKIYSYEELKVSGNKRLPSDVGRDHLERHLSEDEFQRVFQMKRSDFYRLPEWRRIDLKKRLKLF